MSSFTNEINNRLKKYEPLAIISGTTLTIGGLYLFYKVAKDPQEFFDSLKKTFFKSLRYIPLVSGEIDKKREEVLEKIRSKLKMSDDPHPFQGWPKDGMSDEEILGILEQFVQKETPSWKDGKLSGKVYNGRENVNELISKVYSMFCITNALHPDVFPSIRKFEAEIIRLTCTMLNGDEKTCGALTGGGTESILMAMKTYRDYAKNVRGINKPEVVLSEGAHAAFDKAEHYFGIKLIRIPCLPNGEANIPLMEKAITKNTIALVGSAPNYAHGTIDNIKELSDIALKHNLLLHVDACLGGYVLPWAKKLGYNIPDFDFILPGVTSISCDTHKYGFGPKGLSTILFRNKEIRKHMYFLSTDWNGGIYGSPTVAGSRPGGPIAGTWAVLHYLGEKGFLSAAKEIIECRMKIQEESLKIPGLEIVCDHVSPVIAWKSNKFNIFMVGDAMKTRKWVLDPLQKPNAIHLCVTLRHVGREEEFINDLKWACERVQTNPQDFKDGLAPVYGMAAEIPDRSIIGDFISGYLDALLDAM